MSTDPKQPAPSPAVKQREKVRIFTYPKVVFIYPTLIAALICGFGMMTIHDRTADPTKEVPAAQAADGKVAAQADSPLMDKHMRSGTSQNLMGVLFLTVFLFNLLIMALDFPRFTVVGIILLVLFGIFFLLWLGAAFDMDLARTIRGIFGNIYVVANSGFYFMFAGILIGVFGLVWITRWLDYWVIMPNEILHHHGPLSDLEQYKTMNLKIDKEIPDVFEFLMLGAGRLVLHVADERKAIVLDNVPFINFYEQSIKKMMSRMEVRVTTDQEISEP